MKAYVIGSPGKGVGAWKRAEIPEPVVGPGELLVRVRAVSVNYRDYAMSLGLYGGPIADELVPLADASGEVVAVGPGATRFSVGDRVVPSYFPAWISGEFQSGYHASAFGQTRVHGTLRELLTVHESGVVRVPGHLSFEEAATLPCAALTAWNALFEAQAPPLPGSSLLVLGTGGVSVFAAQLALASGVRVIGTTSSAAKARKLRDLGVRDVVDYRETPDWQDRVLELTEGRGVDHVVEVGGAGTLPRSLSAVRAGGTVSLVGILSEPGARIDPLPVLVRSVRLQGIVVGSVSMFERACRTIEALGLRPVVDEVVPFDRAKEGLAKLAEGRHFGKVVVRVSES